MSDIAGPRRDLIDQNNSASRVQDLERRLKSAHEYATLIVKQRNDAQEQLAAERARAERAEAELAQYKLSDDDLGPCARCGQTYTKWELLGAPDQKHDACYALERAEAAEGREARLREALERLRAHLMPTWYRDDTESRERRSMTSS